MKTLNIKSFEKISINPINIKDLQNIKMNIDIFDIEKIKSNPMNPVLYTVNEKINDLLPGYLVKLSMLSTQSEPNIFIVFDHDHMSKLFKSYNTQNWNSGALVRYNETCDEKLSFSLIKNYYGTWPKHKSMFDLNVVSVYETNINLDIFATKQDVVNFYLKNKLYLL